MIYYLYMSVNKRTGGTFMSFISVFDVLGPNMIGPSSSHTAGAAAIALLAGKMPNAAIKKLILFFTGLLPAHIKATEQTAPCSEGSWDFNRRQTDSGFIFYRR